MSDLDADQTDIRPLLALIEREDGYLRVNRTHVDLWQALVQIIGDDARGWYGYGDTPALAVARLVAAVSEYQAALTAATGGQDDPDDSDRTPYLAPLIRGYLDADHIFRRPFGLGIPSDFSTFDERVQDHKRAATGGGEEAGR